MKAQRIWLLKGLLAGMSLALSAMADAGPGDPGGAGPGPFADAWLAPDDVTMCLQIDDAATLRANLAGRPIARLFNGLLTEGHFAEAWADLARASDLDGAALFDLWLGRRFTLFVRSDEAGTDWALLTDADPVRARAVIARLAPRRLAPRFELPIAEIPEHELRLATRPATGGPRYLVGPADGRLFDEIMPRFAGEDVEDRGLAGRPALVKARTLGGCAKGASAALFMHHGAPLNGWSVLVAGLEGCEVAIRHRASFENSPIERPLPEQAWDMSALDAIEDEALVAVIEPTDIGEGQMELFAQALLGEPLLDGPMRKNVGDCRIVAIGEVEGRQEAHRPDMLVPTGAVAIRMKEPSLAAQQLDDAATRLARAIDRLKPGGGAIEVPGASDLANGALRHVDLRPIMEVLSEGHPILSSVTLNWRVARGTRDCYCVVATHPEHLERMVRALETSEPSPARSGRWASCGTFQGRRLGIHLRSHADQAAQLAADAPQDIAAFRDTFMSLSRLCDGVEWCRWQMRRPTVNDVSLDVQVTLSDPESAVGTAEHAP